MHPTRPPPQRGSAAAKAMLRNALSEQDLLALLLTVPYGDEDAGRVWTLLGKLYEGESRVDKVLGAMLEYAKSGDAAFLAAHPQPAAEGAAASCLETLPPRQIVARALLLFIRDLPRRALDDLLSHVTGRHGSEEADKQRKGQDGRGLETVGFALIRDVVVPLAVARAPQYWVCHAVLAALEDCISTRNVDVSAALGRALREQQCGNQLVAAAVSMASTPAARDGGVALLRTLYGKEEESLRAALDNEVIKPLEARGGLERGVLVVRRELGLPVGDSGGKKARPRLPSEDEWDDMVADFMMEESEGESDGYGHSEDGDGGEDNEGGSEGGHLELLAPSVAFQAAQEAEEDGAMHVVEEVFEEDLGSDGDDDEEGGEEEEEDEFGSDSDQSEGSESDEAGSLGGSEPSLAWDDVFSGDDASDGEYMLGEDGEEEEFDEAPNDGSYPEGMCFRGPGGDEEDVDEGGGRGCVDVQPTEMELWS